MAITTKAQLDAAMKGGQPLVFVKTAGANCGNSVFGDTLSNAGNPAPQSLASGTNVTSGVVPVSGNLGFPTINPFGAGNTGYLGGVSLVPTGTNGSMNITRYRLHDCLFRAGAYPFNAAQTLSAQPSYASRIPNADYKGTEIWAECVAAYTGTLTLTITYTNQDGVAGQSTSLTWSVAAISAVMQRLPLAAGDTGVQKIESVTATGLTAGTFNILVLRPLWMGVLCVLGDKDGITHGPDKTGLPVLFATSALHFASCVQGTTTAAAFDSILTIING